jgi:hypothetical protein
MAMRGMTSTAVGAVVLVGLAGYIYFVDWERPVGEEAAKERVFATTASDDVEEVQITLASGATTRVQKVDGRWQIVEPIKTAADDGELSSIAGSLATLDLQQEVEPNATDLARYGLMPPRVDVSFRVKGEKAPRRIHFGDKAPASGELYAVVPGQTRVFLVQSFLDSTFNKDTFALRDKTILAFERDKIDRLELTRGSTTMQFAKSGDNWSIVKPFAGRADFATVEGAIERLGAARMQGIAEPAPADLKRFGLDQPTHVVTVGSGSGSASANATLTLGGTENAVLFAKDASRPMVFTVAPTLRDDVFKDIAEYRRKDLFDSRSFTANRVELRRGGDTIILEKTKAADGKDGWKNGAGAAVDTAKVDDLLTRLSGIRAQSFQPARHPSMNMPALTAVVGFDAGRMETVTFGRAGSEVFASRADEPGTAIVESTTFDETMKALDAVK